MHILIIEDDADFRLETAALLRNSLYRVTALEEFGNIAANLSSICPDLILLDLNLPGLILAIIREFHMEYPIPRFVRMKSLSPRSASFPRMRVTCMLRVLSSRKTELSHRYSISSARDTKRKDDTARRILTENQQTENYVDMVLFYARSDQVYQDYLIKEVCLQETAEEVLQKNKYAFIRNGIQARVDCPDRVYTDVKWISFILNQLVLNAVKYRRDTDPRIWISTVRERRGVRLTVEDNGIGVPEEELPRIFDKGFTGSNGRNRGRSTGMGLYLCRKLSGKLGIAIYAQSAERTGTKIILEFPISSYLSGFSFRSGPPDT